MRRLLPCRRFALILALVAAPPRAQDSRPGSAPASRPASRPNIVVVVADDLGYGDLSVHGARDVATPHIDSIAAHGVRCTNGYVSGPYCSPTRAGLLTGRYQQRFGHEFNPGPPASADPEVGLALTETTLADRLAAAGYATGLVGKWHLGYSAKFQPPRRGFGEFFGFLAGAHPYNPGRTAPRNPVLRGDQPVPLTGYLTDVLAEEAVAFVERHRQEPFFLYLAFNAVHTPMAAPARYRERVATIADPKRRTYAGMLLALDEAVGRVLAALRAAGLEENTLIAFVSDNGGPEQANGSDNGPLRGGKATTWEGGIRVPFFLQWKGRLPAGAVYDQPVIQLDLHATALAAAGVPIAPAWQLDGVDLLPFVGGPERRPPHAALFWRFGEQMAVRAGDWKLVRAVGQPGVRRGVASRPASQAGEAGEAEEDAIPTAALEAAQLFDLAHDLSETRDQSAAQPDKVKELTQLWQAWSKTLTPPRWGPDGKLRR